jgi:DNA-binding transcriptional ArsR family regulator
VLTILSVNAIDVVADPVRGRIVELLAAGEHSAGQLGSVIHDEFGISQPAVSQHLRVLRDTGIANVRAEGTRRLYAVDRLSASYLIALAARVVREVSELVSRAAAAGKRLPTLSIDTEIRFASAADRAAFTAELSGTVQHLVARYHDPSAPGGRPHRLLVVAHPLPHDSRSMRK